MFLQFKRGVFVDVENGIVVRPQVTYNGKMTAVVHLAKDLRIQVYMTSGEFIQAYCKARDEYDGDHIVPIEAAARALSFGDYCQDEGDNTGGGFEFVHDMMKREEAAFVAGAEESEHSD